ncbi:hypothetical protein GF373_13190 [bacterium]|nr:hypothetical protein [bacterium]
MIYLLFCMVFSFGLPLFANAGEPSVWDALQTVEREIPSSANHPGNVFYEGETVFVRVPENLEKTPTRWQLNNDRLQLIKKGSVKQTNGDFVDVGQLGIGWYRVDFFDGDDKKHGFTTAAVLHKPEKPFPQDSPICMDGAIAWFAKYDAVGQANMARLAAMAGVNWFRDRLKWREIELQEAKYTGYANYDLAADVQQQSGLKILQVFHDTPKWAREAEWDGGFPTDLRDVYRFCKKMAERFRGKVQAWEPWNEANAKNFGGHTFHEMYSYQKAAYLGFKAGDPNVTVGFNAYCGVPTDLHARTLVENETWPYFDTYNFHNYNWAHSFEDLWSPILVAACGKQIWLSETDRGMKAESVPPWRDFSHQNDILKAEYIAQEYPTALWNGAHRVFHFILGHYTESGGTQFSLLRYDLTPRPGYVALATLGRFLAGARCLGKYEIEREHVHAYAFRAHPDGKASDVIMVWAEKDVDWSSRGKTEAKLSLPGEIQPKSVYDFMGRHIGKALPKKVGSSPIYIILPPGQLKEENWIAPKQSSPREGEICPIVLHCRFPKSMLVEVEEIPWAVEREVRIPCEEPVNVPLEIYNFSEKPREGVVRVAHLPSGWEITPREWPIRLKPMERCELQCHVIRAEKGNRTTDTWIQFRGEFDAGEPVLALRLVAFPGEGYESLDVMRGK